ncbi:MAG: RHS repeat-associated core domain-containing protein [Candidatus Diapherotrites archaeon]
MNDGFQIVQERDQNQNVINEYTWGQGLPGGIGGLLDLNQGGSHYSYIFDGKGNVTGLLDENANVAATYAYGPFGEPRVPSNYLQQPMQFSTKPYDEKTGLSYYGYRYYVPALGRWLTRDPIGEEGGINLYEFVGNDPVNYIDTDGLWRFPFRPLWRPSPSQRQPIPRSYPKPDQPQCKPAPPYAKGQPPNPDEFLPEHWRRYEPKSGPFDPIYPPPPLPPWPPDSTDDLYDPKSNPAGMI